MSQENINVGTSPNDGQGDPLRTAFKKTNNNFTELYLRYQVAVPYDLTGKPGDVAGMYATDPDYFYYCFDTYDGTSQIWNRLANDQLLSPSQIVNGTSSVDITTVNGPIYVSVGTGGVVAEFVPTGLQVSEKVTANTIQANTLAIGEFEVVNMSVYGNTVADGPITCSNTIIGDVIRGNTSVVTLGNMSSAGNVVALNTFVGNAYGLTGTAPNIVVGNAIVAGTVYTNAQPNITSVGPLVGLTMSGNIIPSVNATYSLGNATNQWRDLWVSSNTIYLGSVPINLTANLGIQVNNVNVAMASNTFVNNGNLTTTDSVNAANISTTGNVNGVDFVASNSMISRDSTVTGNLIANVATFTGLTSAANLVASGFVSAAGNVTGGNLTTLGNVDAASGNFTSTVTVVGTATVGSLMSNSTVSAVGNINTGNALNAGAVAVGGGGIQSGGPISTSGTVSATGVIRSTLGISTPANITAAGTVQGGNVVAIGNVTGINFFGNVVGNITGNVSATTIVATGNITGANLITGGAVSATGNLVALAGVRTNGNVSAAGTVIAAAGVSTAGNVSVTGGVIAGADISTAGNVSATGNVSGNNFISLGVINSAGTISTAGSVLATGNVTGANLITAGNVTALGVTVGLRGISTTGNVTCLDISAGNVGVSGFISTGANISAAGNIAGANISASGNIDSSGNVNVSGNVVATTFYGNIIGNVTGNVSSPGANSQLIFNNNGNLGAASGITTTGVSLSAQGNITAGNLVTGGTVSATGPVISANTVTATAFIGDGGNLANITAGNITGQVANALVSGTVYTNAQPNITSVGTLTSLNSGVISSSGTVTGVNFIGSGNTLSDITGANVTGQVANALISGTVYTNAQPNITSVGTLTSLNTGVISSSGNITGVNFIGNGSTLSDITAANITGQVANALVSGTVYTNAQPNITSLGNLTAISASGLVSTTGNIVGAYVIGNGSALSDITGANVTGQVANALVSGTVYTNAQPNITSVGTLTSLNSGVISSSGTVTAVNFIGSGNTLTGLNGANVTGQVANALIAGTVTANAQPNITSVGTLTALSVTGTVTAANFVGNISGNISGNVTVPGANTQILFNSNNIIGTSANLTFNGTNLGVTGTVTADQFIGSGNTLSNITAGNITGQVANALVSGTVYTNAQPNITSVGTLTSLNTGTVSSSGTVTATAFIGDGGNLANITAGNITGQVANALVSGTVYTNAQPNITSVGTLTGLTSSGNIDAPVFSTGSGNLYMDYNSIATAGQTITLDPKDDGSQAGNVVILGNLQVTGNLLYNDVTTAITSNLIWQAANTATSSSLASGGGLAVGPAGASYATWTYNQPANTWQSNLGAAFNGVVTSSGISVTGVVSAGGTVTGVNFIGSGNTLSNITAGNITGQVANALVSGTVYTAAQPNITSVGNLTAISASGIISTTGNVSGNYFIGNGSTLSDITGANVTGTVALATSATTAATVTTNAQPNITSLGNLTSISASGNISTTGNIAGNYVLGNGAFLTGLPASYSNANVAAYLPTYSGNIDVLGVTTQLTAVTQANADSSSNVATTLYVQNVLAAAGSYGNTQVAQYLASGNVSTNITTTATVTAAQFVGSGNTLSNVQVANITGLGNIATVNLNGNANTYLNGNGVWTAVAPSSSYGDSNVSAYLAGGTDTANIITTGNISGAYILGNGSQLTGLPVPNSIVNGTSNVTIGSANGPITFAANGVSVGSLTDTTVAFGATAGNTSQGANSVAVGAGAGFSTQGVQSVAVGQNAGGTTQSTRSVAIGAGAGQTTQAQRSVAIGYTAGGNAQGTFAVAIGAQSGTTSQASGAIAIGLNSGTASQGTRSVALGYGAGKTSQGAQSIAIGDSAGDGTQSGDSIAIGRAAGRTLQGTSSIAIGSSAADNQQGTQSVAIGYTAASVAQGNNAIAIGYIAGFNTQGANSVAIGTYAGNSSLGVNSVAIGGFAGNSASANNSIIINASGNDLPSVNSGFYVNPVRNDTGNVTNAVFYNTSTNELTYGAISSTSIVNGNSNVIVTSSGGNVSVGIGGTANISLWTSSGQQTTSLGVGTAPSGTAGEIRATNNITSFYSSDRRFKENVASIPDALRHAVAIGGKTFDWTDDYIADHGGEDGYFVRKNDIGVIAQDVQTHLPQAVRTRPDGSLAVDYAKLSALALAAVAELSERLDQVTAELAELKKK